MPKPYTPNDKWSRKAAEEGYRARSVYKLMELDVRYKLLGPGMTVLDLGAAPGSWMQYSAEQVGPRGRVIGFDLQDIQPIAENVFLHKQDITDHEAMKRILAEHGVTKVDLVLSDTAPSTSGIHDIDQWQTLELARSVLAVASLFLRPGGKCVMKVFRGADFDEFLRETKREWDKLKAVKVEASRDRSREVYVVVTKRADAARE